MQKYYKNSLMSINTEIGQVFAVRKYEILIYLTSKKTLEFKYLRCQAAKRFIILLKLALLH